MKKRDIIKLVKETIAKRRKKFYGQHDYYGNNVGGRNSISGMPGVWEEENLDEEGASWGLEIRQIADSFTFDELEQLYKDNKISKEDLTGAKGYLQAWIDQHPTYLPQRDLNTSKRQAIRSYYLDPNRTTPKGGTQSSQFEENTAPKEMAERIKKVFDMVNGARNPVQTPEFWKNRFRQMYGINFPESLKGITKQQALAMNKFGNDMKKYIKQEDLATAEKEYTDAKNDKTIKDKQLAYADELKKDAEMKKENTIKKALSEYIKKRGNDNLMEHMDKHRKRVALMEGAMKRLFTMFDQGLTDEEVVQDHATKGVEVPEAFISKVRKQWENLKKAELELEMGEKEFKNSARDIVNNPVGTETGMEPPMEEKQLASGLSN